MTFTDRFRSGWQRLLAGSQSVDRNNIRAMLCKLYCDATQDVHQLSAHAQQMIYPHIRARLLRIVEEERNLVTWLAEQIRAFGGEPPEIASSETRRQNSWESLRMDEEEEKRDEADLIRRINALEPHNPELAAGLRRLRAMRHRHRAELQDLSMKSNPDEIPPVTSEQELLTEQKAAWLEQQKATWFEQRRATREAEGKQTP